MQASSSPFQAMVEGAEQTCHYVLSLTLPYPANDSGLRLGIGLSVTQLSIERSSTTDLPEGSRLQEGFPSATASFTLTGMVDRTDESKTAAWLFGPYQTSSPLYRKDAFRSPVTIDLGLLPAGAAGTAEVIRKFTGYVDKYSVNQDGSVDFTCTDARSDLRNIPEIPAVVTAPPLNANLTSEFAIDALLRSATKGAISSWPALRTGCVIAAGMRSSVWPEVGTLAPFFNDAFAFAPGRFGTGVTDPVSYTVVGGTLGSNVAAEAWVTPPATGGADLQFDGGNDTARVTVTATDVTLRITSSSGSSTHVFSGLTIGPGTYIGVSLSYPIGTGTWSASVRVGATTMTTGAKTVAGTRSSNFQFNVYPNNAVGVTGGVVEALQVCTGTTSTWNNAFVPKAVLDPSLNPLQVVPPVQGDVYQVIQQLAAAELGFAGFDETGVFFFYNRLRLRGATSVRTITSTASLQSLSVEQSAASVINRAQIGYTPWIFASSPTTIYSLETPKRIPARATTTITVNLDSLVADVDTSLIRLPDGTTSTASWFRASIDKAGTASYPNPSSLIFTVRQPSPNVLTIAVKNPNSTAAWLVSSADYLDLTAGTPVLRISGLLVSPDTELSADYQYPPLADGGAAASRFGEVPFQLAGNPWLQDDDAALALAQDIVNQSSQPIPNLTNVAIVPDPRLQLGDRVRIQDPDLTGVDEYAQIFSIRTDWAAQADGSANYSMTIDARTIARPGGWILGVAGRSELGGTTWI